MDSHLIFLFKIYAFIFGALFGSFTNVLIYRLPLEKSVVWPRSFCPHCLKTIYWYENIPILSFIFLRGRCHKCQAKISWRYPLIELLGGVAALYLFPIQLNILSLLLSCCYLFIFLALVAHFFIDLAHFILPDEINVFLGVAFLTLSLVEHSWPFVFWGGLLGFLFPFGVALLYQGLRGQIGLGGGDVKLFTVLGFYLGPLGVVQNIFLSALLGTILGLPALFLKKIDQKTPIPYGPFIILTAIVQIYFPQIVDTYVSPFFILFQK